MGRSENTMERRKRRGKLEGMPRRPGKLGENQRRPSKLSLRLNGGERGTIVIEDVALLNESMGGRIVKIGARVGGSWKGTSGNVMSPIGVGTTVTEEDLEIEENWGISTATDHQQSERSDAVRCHREQKYRDLERGLLEGTGIGKTGEINLDVMGVMIGIEGDTTTESGTVDMMTMGIGNIMVMAIDIDEMHDMSSTPDLQDPVHSPLSLRRIP